MDVSVLELLGLSTWGAGPNRGAGRRVSVRRTREARGVRGERPGARDWALGCQLARKRGGGGAREPCGTLMPPCRPRSCTTNVVPCPPRHAPPCPAPPLPAASRPSPPCSGPPYQSPAPAPARAPPPPAPPKTPRCCSQWRGRSAGPCPGRRSPCPPPARPAQHTPASKRASLDRALQPPALQTSMQPARSRGAGRRLPTPRAEPRAEGCPPRFMGCRARRAGAAAALRHNSSPHDKSMMNP